MKRVLSMALMLAMLCTLLPLGTTAVAESQYGYLVIRNTTVNRVVNFRKAPNQNDNTNYPIDRLPEFWVVEVLGEETKSGTKWCRVSCPTTQSSQAVTGYVMASFVQLMTADEQAAWLAAGSPSIMPGQSGGSPTAAPAVTPTPTPALPGTAIGFVQLTLDKVNMRLTPAGKVLTEKEADKLPKGEVLPYYSEVANIQKYNWVQVIYKGQMGYIRSDCYVKLGDSSATPQPGSPTAQPGTPVQIPTATPQPGAYYHTGEGVGYLVTIRDQAPVYEAPGSSKLATETKVTQGTMLTYYAYYDYTVVDYARVYFNGVFGYIPSDYFALTNSSRVPVTTPAPDNTQTKVGGAKGYVKTVENNVKLFVDGEGEADNLLPFNMVLPYSSVANGRVTVSYNGKTGTINSGFYVYCTKNGAAAGSSTVVDPDDPTLPETAIGFIKLKLDKVNLRKAPAGAILTEKEKDKLPKDTMLAYYELKTNVQKFDWALVSYNGMIGYIRSDCFYYCDESGNPITAPTQSPTTAPSGAPTADPTGETTFPDGTYGKTNMDSVMFRKTMSVNGDYWARLPYNWTVEVLSAEYKGSTLWYKVRGGTPSNPTHTYLGYIHSGYLTIIGLTPTAAPSPTDSAYAVVTINGINLRRTAGGDAITALRSNTVVNVITRPAGTSANDWFFVEINGAYGYLPATSLRILTKDELDNFVLPPAPAPTVTPSPTPAYTGTGYVKLKLDKVNIRRTPGGTVLTPRESDKLPIGLVLAYTEGPVTNGRYQWVKITYKGMTGYVRSDCYVMCDASGNTSVPTPTPNPDSTPAPVGNYVRLIKGGVNVRSAPWGTSYGQLPKGTILPYTNTVRTTGGEVWYQVYVASMNVSGYVLGSLVEECDASGNKPLPTAIPTLDPSATSTPSGMITGYVATSVSSVWLRSSPNVNAGTAGKVAKKGTVLPMTGPAISYGVYTWYPVQLNDGTRGYLRGDCVFQLADWQLAYYNTYGVCPTPTPGPATPKPGNSSFIITTGDKLWVRASASKQADVLGQLSLGTVIQFTRRVTAGKVDWYQVNYNGNYGYLHGDFVRVMTNAEYYEWQNKNATPAPTVTAMPDPSTFSDLALTTIDRVKIRQSGSMNGRELTLVYTAGTKLTYLGNYIAPVAGSADSYWWFNVRYGSVSGWMRGDCVRILTQEEKALYDKTGNPDAPREATYRTLSLNDTGDDVTALQNKLVEKGMLISGAYTAGLYDTATRNAVLSFQKSYGLAQDGIAGEKTQHALFGTVPEGTYSGGTVTPVLYPVEKIDWYTGGIQSIWSVGTVGVVTDVYTGISFRAQRLYGDNHADCEPLTTADTAAICQIYGVSNAQEISDREQALQSWRRRPLWVTIGTRTFCASMYGIPHNYEGDRIPDNNYNGQFCVHFLNSRTHSTNKVDERASYNGYFSHQDAIQYAYSHSQSGTK